MSNFGETLSEPYYPEWVLMSDKVKENDMKDS